MKIIFEIIISLTKIIRFLYRDGTDFSIKCLFIKILLNSIVHISKHYINVRVLFHYFGNEFFIGLKT